MTSTADLRRFRWRFRLSDFCGFGFARDDIFRGTPLTWAVIGGNREMVEFFLENGAVIDLRDDEKWTTPRFWAEYLRHTEIVKVLSESQGPKQGR